MWHLVTARDDDASGSGSAAFDTDELFILSGGAAASASLAAAWATAGAVAVLHRFWLHDKYTSSENMTANAEKTFFQAWARAEGNGLLFLYCALYLGPVTKCLELVASHEATGLLWTAAISSACVCAAYRIGGYTTREQGESSTRSAVAAAACSLVAPCIPL